MVKKPIGYAIALSMAVLPFAMGFCQAPWQSRWVSMRQDSVLIYMSDSLGNRIPDFSGVGYLQNRTPLPAIPVAAVVRPDGKHDQEIIQKAIDELSARVPGPNGFRGAILLKSGTYRIPGTLFVHASGIVIRGEGQRTVLRATGRGQRRLIEVSGYGTPIIDSSRAAEIVDGYVPVGATSFVVSSTRSFQVGDSIMLYRPATAEWIADLHMDRIDRLDSNTRQWTPEEYGLSYERLITAIRGDTVFIDNPVVMAMERKYGGGKIYAYGFPGRIGKVGVEDLLCQSDFDSDEDEQHGWIAVYFDRVANGWISRVSSRYFGYACVSLGRFSRNITVSQCRSESPKSKIIGGRRYSFNNDGQLNLVMHCVAMEGRHDFVTGARVCGPNVFYDCRAYGAHADIGPHHRWATGTLYDNIITDGAIHVQDRGNWGTGHGWAGANQVIWNCRAASATVQSPWVSAVNFIIGFTGNRAEGRMKGRLPGIWEGQNQPGLQPASLYLMQLRQVEKVGY